MDTRSIALLEKLHPAIRQSAIDAYNEAVQATPEGVHPVIDQTNRSFAESDILYQKGRTTPGPKVSNAKAGESLHNYDLALDFHLVVNGVDKWEVDHNWMIVVNVFKKHGFEWGGDWHSFQDYPHLQKTLGHTWQQLLVKHNAKDFIEGTNYINL